MLVLLQRPGVTLPGSPQHFVGELHCCARQYIRSPSTGGTKTGDSNVTSNVAVNTPATSTSWRRSIRTTKSGQEQNAWRSGSEYQEVVLAYPQDHLPHRRRLLREWSASPEGGKCAFRCCPRRSPPSVRKRPEAGQQFQRRLVRASQPPE